MFKWAFSLGALVLTVGINAMTYAAPLTATDLLTGFNAIIFSDASTTSDIEGASIIGNNFSGNASIYITPKGVSLPDTFNALNVYGSTVGGYTVNVNNSGNVYVAGATDATINFNGGHYVTTEPSLGISEISSMMKNLSTSLSQLTANSTLPTPDNNEIITATAGSSIAVFNITTDDLSKIPSYLINSNGATTIIFNVSGTALNFNANYEGDDSLFDNIIWNFYEATSLHFETLLGGTVLAPLASVTNSNQIDGTLVAETWSGNGELHEYGFDGTLPVSSPTPVATPEPATLVLFLSGAGLIALRRRSAGRARNDKNR